MRSYTLYSAVVLAAEVVDPVWYEYMYFPSGVITIYASQTGTGTVFINLLVRVFIIPILHPPLELVSLKYDANSVVPFADSTIDSKNSFP